MTRHRKGKQRNGDRQCVGDKTRDPAEILTVVGKWSEKKKKKKCCDEGQGFSGKVSGIKTVCVSGGPGWWRAGLPSGDGRQSHLRVGVDAHTLTRLHVRDSTTKGGPEDSN